MVNAYLLPLSALLLLGGAAGDRFGRRLLLVVGIAVFALASYGCAVASTLTWLATRGRAIGIWAAMGAVTGAAGPILGGWLIDTVGWRAIFLLNLPLAVAAIGLALGFVRDPPANPKPAPLDLLGALLATASLGVVTWD